VKFTNEKLEATHGNVRAQEARVARQQEMIAAAIEARHPLDDLQARLLVMGQSLLAMKRFLAILERDLEMSLGIHRPQRPMRLRAEQPDADADANADPNPEPGQTDTP
jgi:hypothetical protein